MAIEAVAISSDGNTFEPRPVLFPLISRSIMVTSVAETRGTWSTMITRHQLISLIEVVETV